jgi:hypothetical protein
VFYSWILLKSAKHHGYKRYDPDKGREGVDDDNCNARGGVDGSGDARGGGGWGDKDAWAEEGNG